MNQTKTRPHMIINTSRDTNKYTHTYTHTHCTRTNKFHGGLSLFMYNRSNTANSCLESLVKTAASDSCKERKALLLLLLPIVVASVGNSSSLVFNFAQKS